MKTIKVSEYYYGPDYINKYTDTVCIRCHTVGKKVETFRVIRPSKQVSGGWE